MWEFFKKQAIWTKWHSNCCEVGGQEGFPPDWIQDMDGTKTAKAADEGRRDVPRGGVFAFNA